MVLAAAADLKQEHMIHECQIRSPYVLYGDFGHLVTTWSWPSLTLKVHRHHCQCFRAWRFESASFQRMQIDAWYRTWKSDRTEASQIRSRDLYTDCIRFLQRPVRRSTISTAASRFLQTCTDIWFATDPCTDILGRFHGKPGAQKDRFLYWHPRTDYLSVGACTALLGRRFN